MSADAFRGLAEVFRRSFSVPAAVCEEALRRAAWLASPEGQPIVDVIDVLARNTPEATRSEAAQRLSDRADRREPSALANVFIAVDEFRDDLPHEVLEKLPARISALASSAAFGPGWTRRRDGRDVGIDSVPHIGTDPEAETRMIQEDEARRILSLIDQSGLSDRESDVVFRCLGEMSPAEIAQDLAIKRGNVDVVLTRARKKIRSHL